MKKLLEYIKPYFGVMLFGLFVKFTAAMLDLLIPFVLEKILDDVVPTGDKVKVFTWGGIMVAFAVASVVTNVYANRLATRTSGKITLKLRHDLFAKISYLSAEDTDKFTIPSLISRLTTDTYNINQMLTRTQRLGIRGPILLIGGIIITLTLDPILTLVLAGSLPIIAITVYFVTKISVPIYTSCQRILDRLVCVVQENITGVRVIKALSKTEYEKKRFFAVNEKMAKEEEHAGFVMAITNPTASLVLNIGMTLVIIVGAFRVNSGLTETGKIIAFMSYFTIILNAMLGITRIFIVCSKGAASAARVEEVLNANEGLPITEFEAADSPYHIEMENVSFSYNKIENNLTDINFKLRRGETLGIIGSTGSGKSTIVNLLIRFYDPDSGTIRISGRDIRSIPRSELCPMFGIAFQNDFIMADSIRENIDYGRMLSDGDIANALKLAQADEFVNATEGRTEHQLSARGTNISGGQKQRLIIARALAARPEILILDDSSSALDYRTDASLRKALHNAFPDMTSVIIAQRISSIMNANHILVLDDGHIIGSGTHEELLRSCPTYMSIAETQMGGERYA